MKLKLIVITEIKMTDTCIKIWLSVLQSSVSGLSHDPILNEQIILRVPKHVSQQSEVKWGHHPAKTLVLNHFTNFIHPPIINCALSLGGISHNCLLPVRQRRLSTSYWAAIPHLQTDLYTDCVKRRGVGCHFFLFIYLFFSLEKQFGVITRCDSYLR